MKNPQNYVHKSVHAPCSILSRVCRVQGLSCPGFVVSRVCRVQGLSVQGLSVQGLSVQGLSVYRNRLAKKTEGQKSRDTVPLNELMINGLKF
jgi:hypothetical protein